MQIKKDEMEKRLLLAAREEFLEKGFQGASIRSIVKSADTTIGNFYNYFENKEAIFDSLVIDVYNGFKYVMGHHNQLGEADVDINGMDIPALRAMIGPLLESILPMMGSSLILLIEKSNGTKYQNVKPELLEIMSSHFLIHIEETNPLYAYPEIGRILALQLIDGVLDILHTAPDFDTKLNLLTELTIYTITGTIGILHGGQNDKSNRP